MGGTGQDYREGFCNCPHPSLNAVPIRISVRARARARVRIRVRDRVRVRVRIRVRNVQTLRVAVWMYFLAEVGSNPPHIWGGDS